MHHRRHPLIAGLGRRLGLDLPVVRLPADAKVATGSGETQAGYLPLLDDSPEGFFGSCTPYSLRITSSIASNNWAFSWASLS